MAGKGVLSIKIIGDDSGLKKTLGGVSGRLDKFGGKMQGAGMALTKGLTLPLAAAGAGFLALRNDAAELESRIEKTKIVFGEQTAVVKDWAKENAGAMGLTSNEAAGLAANFGDLLIPMGFTREAAAGMSTDVVGLSGALSAWTGGTKSAAEVSAILSKAMLGEREGLKELGVSITEAEVSARLLENGQADLTGQQLQQAKATATQQLIMEKTTDAQAAFNDGTETLAEQQLKSKAATKEVKDALVIALMPAYKKFASFLTDTLAPFLVNTVIPAIQDFGSKLKDLGEWFSELSPKWQKVIIIAGLFVAALGPILFVGGKVISIGGKLIGVIRGMGAAMTFLAANPVVLIIIAIAALAAGLVIAYKKTETFRDIVDAVWAKVQSVISYAWKNIIKPVFDALNDFTQDHLIPIFHNFMGVTETVFKAIWKAIKYAWNTVIKPIYEALKWYITTILIPVFKDFQGIAETVFKAIWKVIKYAWNDIIKPVFSALKKFIVDTLIPKFREFMGVVETVWDTVGGAIKTAWNSVIKPVLTPLYNFIKDKLSPVWKTFSDAASTAWGKLGGIINSALRTIGGPVSKFLKVVASIASAIGANNLAGIARSGAASAGACGQSSTNTGIARNRGGWVPGSGPDRDSVPAVLTPGCLLYTSPSPRD